MITNLPSEGRANYLVDVQDYHSRMDFYPNYETVADDELFLIEGSCKTLEISLKNGNANARLHMKTGQRIEIV